VGLSDASIAPFPLHLPLRSVLFHAHNVGLSKKFKNRQNPDCGRIQRSTFRSAPIILITNTWFSAVLRIRGGLSRLAAWHLPVVRRPGGPPRQMLKDGVERRRALSWGRRVQGSRRINYLKALPVLSYSTTGLHQGRIQEFA